MASLELVQNRELPPLIPAVNVEFAVETTASVAFLTLPVGCCSALFRFRIELEAMKPTCIK